MKNKRALVTLVIGNEYKNRFEQLCTQNWLEYAERCKYDLVVFDRPLDKSERASNRSPSWQKLLILEQPQVMEYEQVAWIDSDILINSMISPCIFTDVPTEKVGAVDLFASPSRLLNRAVLRKSYSEYKASGTAFIDNLEPKRYYENYGLPPKHEQVVQAGVMVLSPKHHKNVFRSVYDTYEERGGPEWNYEMRPLSFELLEKVPKHWLDYRFNMIWPYQKRLFYPHLRKRTMFEKISRKAFPGLRAREIEDSVNTAFLNAFFLHFAASANEMGYVNHSAISKWLME